MSDDDKSWLKAINIKDLPYDIPEGWEDLFDELEDIILGIFKKLKDKSIKFHPPVEDHFNAFHKCPLDKVRVVICGQDPYPNPNHACGMSFSVRPGEKPPSSLVNIFKCIKKLYPDFEIPNHGDLTRWCEQGVLLLNTCLTYSATFTTKTQKLFWMPFISKIVAEICRVNPNVVFVLWGNDAQQQIGNLLDNKTIKLTGIHPSGMNGNKFVETVTHFRDINDMFEKAGKPLIRWALTAP